ncbi:MAG: zinc metalloprotease HtpX [Bacteroidetes bacterium]|jgi:heat shock protein HtpX|nr:zinc metalloprotease HtpX [Bacteroidota bacterium]
MNMFRTAALMAVMIVLFALIGRAIAGPGGMMIAFLFAIGLNFFSYWFSDKIVLKMYGAEEVSRQDAPELVDMVDRLRQRAGLPMPRVCIMPSDNPNAFATGRNPEHAVVAVTEGIMRSLDRDELAGVIAHELAHIENRDILTSSIAATLASAITLLAQFGFYFGGRDRGGLIGSLLMLILAPIAATLIQTAISRTREFAADRDGARISGNPRGLANALARLQQGAEARPMQASANTENTAHMFIVNPFAGAMSGLANLFSTHPPTEERIERLNEMAQTGEF